MKLLSLYLHNFKGIRDFELSPEGKNITVYGDNATGKTTLFDALLWLLFGKDSQGQSNFEIKTLDELGNPLSGLDHSVEGVFTLGDQKLQLKRVYYEEWAKKRGSAIAEMKGNTTDYFINEVPVPKKDYDSKIAEIAPEKIFRLLTDPSFFNEQMKWQDRRTILLEVCGHLEDSEVIASDEKLSKLPEILGSHSIDEKRKILASRRKEINAELERIPVRIEELAKGIPDIANRDQSVLQSEITKILDEIKAVDDRIIATRSGGQEAQIKNQIQELNAQLLELDNLDRQARAEVDTQNESGKQEHQKKCSAILQQKSNFQDEEFRLKGLQRSQEILQDDRKKVAEEWEMTEKQTFIEPVNSVCPTCGQAVQLDTETLQGEFNLNKATRLEELNIKGTKLKSQIDELEQKIKDLEKSNQELQTSIENQEKAIGVFSPIPYPESTTTNKRVELQQKKIELESQLSNSNNSQDEIITTLENEKTVLESQRKEKEDQLRLFTKKEELEERIEQHKEEEKKLAAEFSNLEQSLFLTEEFIRTKVELLETRINERFETARFKLFETQVNGGLAECCETTCGGVTFSSLNNAARINVGLDIINTLSKHYGFTAPIFIDNRESIVQLIPVNTQLISLVVSGQDKKLRIESEEK